MLESWHSYPHIYTLGHGAVKDLLLDEVLVEEKVDGSQFSFGKFTSEDGTEYLRCKSRGSELNVGVPEKMFVAAVETCKALFPKLHNGWAYRGEVLAKPKHNVLAYNRVPTGNIILFDINHGEEKYLSYQDKQMEAANLGLEIVPWIYFGRVVDIELFRSFLDRESILGGQKVEGVVIKNYSRFGRDGKVLMGKFVSEAFKEVHAKEWREQNPKSGDILDRLVLKYRSPARWAKAIQHLRESGQLEQSPRDIGKLIPAVGEDIKTECEEEIKQLLFDWAWPHMKRGTISGLPEWYKEELLKLQFEVSTNEGRV